MRLHIIFPSLLVSCCAFALPATAPKEGAPAASKMVKLKMSPLPPSTEEYLVAQLADAKWMPAQKLEPKMAPGAEIALIGAEPMSTGPTVYLRLKPGYVIPSHWHTHLEYATMIAGKGRYVVDGKKTLTLPGTFVVVPSKAKHEFSCDADAECVFIVRRSGPTDYNWVAK